MSEQEQAEMLDLLEELSRCMSVGFDGSTALLIGEERLVQLRALVKKHRPVSWHLEGGRRFRGDKCID